VTIKITFSKHAQKKLKERELNQCREIEREIRRKEGIGWTRIK